MTNSIETTKDTFGTKRILVDGKMAAFKKANDILWTVKNIKKIPMNVDLFEETEEGQRTSKKNEALCLAGALETTALLIQSGELSEVVLVDTKSSVVLAK